LQAALIQAIFEHVKGHQDNEVPAGELDLLAQLNVKADQHGGDQRASNEEYGPVIPLQPTCPVALDIDSKTIH
jgi:hypothetical protein